MVVVGVEVAMDKVAMVTGVKMSSYRNRNVDSEVNMGTSDNNSQILSLPDSRFPPPSIENLRNSSNRNNNNTNMDNNLNINTLQCDLSVCRESNNIIDELEKGIIVDNPDLQHHNFNKIPASPHILCNISNIKI